MGKIRSMLGANRRLAQFLYLQRVKGFPPPDQLGLDESAMARFEAELSASRHYLEFGSGGSTLAADRMGIPTLTVEGDRFYARVVRASLSPSTRVEVMDVYLGLTGEWSNPLFRRQTKRRMRRWRRYSHEPFRRLADKGWFPDFVLVDGRFRRACFLEAMRAAQLAGHSLTIMFDDYYKPHNEHYHAVERWAGNPERAGRAALFVIRPDRPSGAPNVQDIDDASRDYR